MRKWTSMVSTVFVFICGCIFIYFTTDGGKAWTTESARRIDVINNPWQIPPSQLTAIDNKIVTVEDFNKRIQLVDFIFTKCPTTCIGLGLAFKQLQHDLVVNKMDKDVHLISISFDLKNDTPGNLESYLKKYNARSDQWNGYVFRSEQDKNTMLDTLGIIVIPDDEVGFIHNAAIYMVEDGKVIGIFDFDSKDEILARLSSLIG